MNLYEQKQTKLHQSNSIHHLAQQSDRVPPQAIDIEKAVLGAVMLESKAVDVCKELNLQPEHFYHSAHSWIYQAVLDLKDAPIDMLTVTQELIKTDKLNQIGGAAYIAELVSRVASAANLEYHTRIVLQKSLQRRIIIEASRIVDAAFDANTDVGELVDLWQQKGYEFEPQNIQATLHIQETIETGLRILEKGNSHKTAVPFTALADLVPFFTPAELWIIAASPSMGKTAFAYSLVRECAKQGTACMFFSLEMGKEQMFQRIAVSESDENVKKPSALNWNKLENDLLQLSRTELYFNFNSKTTPAQVRAQVRKYKKLKNIKLVVIDYLQIMGSSADSPKFADDTRRITDISADLKAIAKDLDVTVLALSQLNKEHDKNHHKRPTLANIRGSFAIVQDADVVVFPHRPEKVDYELAKANGELGLAQIIVAKNRNGQTGETEMFFDAEKMLFTDVLTSEIPF